MDEFGQTFVVRLVMRLQYKDGMRRRFMRLDELSLVVRRDRSRHFNGVRGHLACFGYISRERIILTFVRVVINEQCYENLFKCSVNFTF